MKLQSQVNLAYFNLNISAGEMSKKHIVGIRKGYKMEKEFFELNNMFNLKFIFDNCLAYMDNEQISQICDFSNQYNYNQ